MDDKYYFLRRTDERVDESPKVSPMGIKAVGIRSRMGKLFRVTHPDHIGRDQSSNILEFRHDVAPEVGGCRIAVKEKDWISLSVILEGHPLPVNFKHSFGQWPLTHDVTYE
jgi:hypothetical protein